MPACLAPFAAMDLCTAWLLTCLPALHPLQRWIYAVDPRRLSECSDDLLPEEAVEGSGVGAEGRALDAAADGAKPLEDAPRGSTEEGGFNVERAEEELRLEKERRAHEKGS